MTAKAISKKILLFLLMLSMVLSLAGCGGEKNAPDGGDGKGVEENSEPVNEAYRDVLQGIVDEYGILSEYDIYREGYDEDVFAVTGLYDAAVADFDYDGDKELFVLYLENSYLFLEIYESEGENASLVWSATESAESLVLNEVKGKYYCYVGNIRYSTAVYSYYNGEYLSSVDVGHDFNEKELQAIDKKISAMDEEDTGEIYKLTELMRFGIDENPGDKVNTLIDLTFNGRLQEHNKDKLVKEWNLKLPESKYSPVRAFKNIKYYGDTSICKMSKEMALAYAEVIDDLIKDSADDIFTMAILADINGDGMPLLLTAETDSVSGGGLEAQYMKVWTWDGSKATAYDFENNVGQYSHGGVLGLSIYEGNGSGTIVTTDCYFIMPTLSYYKVSNGQISFDYTYADVGIRVASGETVGYGGFKYGIDSVQMTEHGYEFSEEILRANGWVYDEAERKYRAIFINDEMQKFDTYEDYRFYQERTNNGNGYRDSKWHLTEYSTEGPTMVKENWSLGKGVAAALSLYAKADRAEKVNLDIEHSNFSNGIKYLEEILKSLGGNIPDDTSNTEISNYISKFVSKKSETDISSDKNKINLSSDSISASIKAAIEAKDDMLALCGKYDIELSKTPICSARIVCRDIDSDGVRRITFDSDIAETIDGCDEIRLILGDDRSYIVISAEDMKAICSAYPSWSIEIEPVNDIEYKIIFKDGNGAQIDKLGAQIGFSIPGGGDLYTIELSAGDKSMNWGGQPNSELGSTEFSTAYSGTYTIVKKDMDIDDISELSDEEQEMIEFIVARDIMSAEDGSFEPDKETSRYEFAKAFVHIFYNYDDSKPCSFSDVPRDSEYYGYVASGEELKVIEGYPDGTFMGNETVTMEEAIAFCSRILADYKKYSYPEATAEYLSFDDKGEISPWAEKEIALAVREGLVDKGGILNPQSKIDRKQSAELLYRLYMLLHDSETTVAGDINSRDTDGENTVLIVAVIWCAIILVLVIAVLAFILIKKNKKAVPEVQKDKTE